MNESELRALIGYDVVDRDGKSVGNVEFIFNDDVTGRPEWIGVITGTFRHSHVLVPVSGAQRAGVSLQVPWPKDRVTGAPTYELGRSRVAISKEQERTAYTYYGIEEPALA